MLKEKLRLQNQRLILEKAALKEALTLAVENIEAGQGLYVSHRPGVGIEWQLDNKDLIEKLQEVLNQ